MRFRVLDVPDRFRQAVTRIVLHVDQQVIDGAVNGTGIVSDEAGDELSKVQTGRVQQYGALLFGGAVLLVAGLIVFI